MHALWAGQLANTTHTPHLCCRRGHDDGLSHRRVAAATTLLAATTRCLLLGLLPLLLPHNRRHALPLLLYGLRDGALEGARLGGGRGSNNTRHC
jgi:hypothetical protein